MKQGAYSSCREATTSFHSEFSFQKVSEQSDETRQCAVIGVVSEQSDETRQSYALLVALEYLERSSFSATMPKAKTRSRFCVLIISIISEADNVWGFGVADFFVSFFKKRKMVAF